MKKFASLGKWHVHAPQYADEVNHLEGCTIAKVWDPDPEVAKAWAKELDAEACSVQDILSDPEIEGVIVANATNEHTPLMLDVCASGKALFTEKVLALTNEDAQAIAKAVKDNNIRFAISFPHVSESPVQFVLNAAKSGKLGTINYARFRKAHNGATAGWLPEHFFDPVACGGGAMIDLGAHPMYLLCEILGEPIRVQSGFTHVTGKAVEDNAVSLLTFEGGAIGVSETGFVSQNYPLTFELGGTDGALLMRDDEVTWCCPETGNRWVRVETLPERRPSPLTQWALAEKPEDIPAEFDIDAAVRLTKVMVMAYAE